MTRIADEQLWIELRDACRSYPRLIQFAVHGTMRSQHNPILRKSFESAAVYCEVNECNVEVWVDLLKPVILWSCWYGKFTMWIMAIRGITGASKITITCGQQSRTCTFDGKRWVIES
jgi:hypothetical protein